MFKERNDALPEEIRDFTGRFGLDLQIECFSQVVGGISFRSVACVSCSGFTRTARSWGIIHARGCTQRICAPRCQYYSEKLSNSKNHSHGLFLYDYFRSKNCIRHCRCGQPLKCQTRTGERRQVEVCSGIMAAWAAIYFQRNCSIGKKRNFFCFFINTREYNCTIVIPISSYRICTYMFPNLCNTALNKNMCLVVLDRRHHTLGIYRTI